MLIEELKKKKIDSYISEIYTSEGLINGLDKNYDIDTIF